MRVMFGDFSSVPFRDFFVTFSWEAGLLFVNSRLDLSVRLDISRWKFGILRQARLGLGLWPRFSLPAFAYLASRFRWRQLCLVPARCLWGVKRCSLDGLAWSLRSSRPGASEICTGCWRSDSHMILKHVFKKSLLFVLHFVGDLLT